MTPGPISVSPLRILIVEDHPDSRKYLKMFLECKGHSVRAACSVAEGQALFKAEEPQVLISDIGLPDGSGCDLLRLLEPTKPLLAIAMSGFGAVSDAQRSSEAGFDHHLVKPFLPDCLDPLLERAAKRADS